MAKLETGYFVALKGFVRTNPHDIEAQERVIAAIKRAKAGDPAEMLAMLSVDSLKVQSVTRRGKAEPQPALVEGS